MTIILLNAFIVNFITFHLCWNQTCKIRHLTTTLGKKGVSLLCTLKRRLGTVLHVMILVLMLWLSVWQECPAAWLWWLPTSWRWRAAVGWSRWRRWGRPGPVPDRTWASCGSWRSLKTQNWQRWVLWSFFKQQPVCSNQRDEEEVMQSWKVGACATVHHVGQHRHLPLELFFLKTLRCDEASQPTVCFGALWTNHLLTQLKGFKPMKYINYHPFPLDMKSASQTPPNDSLIIRIWGTDKKKSRSRFSRPALPEKGRSKCSQWAALIGINQGCISWRDTYIQLTLYSCSPLSNLSRWKRWPHNVGGNPEMTGDRRENHCKRGKTH